MNGNTSASQRPDSLARPPNPWVAAGLSFVLPGAGQAFNGRFWKGVLLLILSFLVLPAEALCLTYLGSLASVAVLLPLLAPWIYSMVDAAREAMRLEQSGIRFDATRGAIYVTILLVVIFPIVALLFCIVTLFLLPSEILLRIADWTASFRRASGLGR
jgi:hypothetical protein